MVCSAPCCSVFSAFGAVFLFCISSMFAREPEYVMEGITIPAPRASTQCQQAGQCSVALPPCARRPCPILAISLTCPPQTHARTTLPHGTSIQLGCTQPFF